MRSNERKKELGEVFTPPELVNEMLDQLPTDIWAKPDKTWLDPTCGNGNFLVEVKRRLEEAGHSSEHILQNMVFGVDIMEDNCRECIRRLYGYDDSEIETFPDPNPTLAEYSENPFKGQYLLSKRYKKPGVIAVFYRNGILIPNIVQADGLVYDYSFGSMDYSGINPLFASKEIYCPITHEKNTYRGKPHGDHVIVQTVNVKPYKLSINALKETRQGRRINTSSTNVLSIIDPSYDPKSHDEMIILNVHDLS